MLSISKMTDYGVVILACFIDKPKDQVLKAIEITEITGLPLPTVSKLLKIMSSGGLLESHRGAYGGYSLLKDASEVTLKNIITMIDGPMMLTACVGDVSNCGSDVCRSHCECPLKENWNVLNSKIVGIFDKLTLKEFVKMK